MSCYQFIDQQRIIYSVRLLCQLLRVVPARYYAWRKRPATARPVPEPVAWEEALQQTFTHHRKRYGTRRLRVELQAQGHRVGRQRLRTARRARLAGLTAARFYPAHHRLHPRATLRPQPAARPAGSYAAQPGVGQ